MAQQLAYVIITPYSLHKSRTGGILSRLITRTGLDLVGARMFAPSVELVKRYSDETISANDPQDRRVQELTAETPADHHHPLRSDPVRLPAL